MHFVQRTALGFVLLSGFSDVAAFDWCVCVCEFVNVCLRPTAALCPVFFFGIQLNRMHVPLTHVGWASIHKES